MGKSNTASTPLSYKMYVFTPIMWALLTLPWRLSIYAWWALIILLRGVVIALGAVFAVGVPALILFVVGVLLLPSQGSQKQFQNAFTSVGETVEDIAVDIVDFFILVLDCKEVIVEFWNTIWRFFAAIVNIVFEALDDIFNFGLDTGVFEWAYRAARMEKELAREELLDELEHLTVQFENELGNATRSIEPRHRGAFLEMMRRKMHRIAKAHVYGSNTVVKTTRFTLLPAAVCNAIEKIFDFIINLIDIIRTFVLNFLDFMVGLFDFFANDFDLSFLAAFVQFIIVEILRQIPFTGCFVSIDDLEVTPIDEYPKLFIDQTPTRLISCLCGYRYRNALGIPCILSSNYDGGDGPCDIVPKNIGAAIIGCICIDPGVEFDENTKPIPALLECLQIDVLIKLFEDFVDLLERVYKVIINALETAFNWLKQQFYRIKGAFDSLLRAFRRIFRSGFIYEQLTPEERAEIDAELDEAERISGEIDEEDRRSAGLFDSISKRLDQLRRASDFRERVMEEFYQQTYNETYVEHMRSHPIYQPVRAIIEPVLIRYVATLNHIRNNAQNMSFAFQKEELGRSMRTHFAKMAFRTSDHKFVREFAEQLQANFTDPESVEHIKGVFDGFKGIMRVAGWSLMTAPRMPALREELRSKVNMTAFVRGVFHLGDKLREINHPGTKRSESTKNFHVSGKLWVASIINPDSLKRVVRHIEEEYGEDPAVRRGIMGAMRALPSAYKDKHGAFNRVMKRYNITNEDLDRMHESKRAQNDARAERQKKREKEVFDLRKYAHGQVLYWYDTAKARWDSNVIPDNATAPQAAAIMSKRVIEVGIIVGGGAAISVVSIAGFALAGGLAFLLTLLVAILIPLLVILVIFLLTVLQFVMHIGTGVIQNTFRGDDEAAVFDIVTPIFGVLTDLVASSYTQGYSIGGLNSAVSEIGDIGVDSVQYALHYFVRNFMCKFPISVSPYTCPRLMRVDPETGMPDESFVDWLLDSTIFFPQDAPCFHTGHCGGGDCVCAGTPSRVGTPDAPCISAAQDNYCNGWPLIRERINMQPLEVNIDWDVDCAAVLNINIENLKYYNHPDFKELGFGFDWLMSDGFWSLAKEILNVWKETVRFLVQRLTLGIYVRWSGSVSTIASSLWFIPAGPLNVISLVTISGNTMTESLNNFGVSLIKFFTRHSNTVFIGPWCQEGLRWMRFDNWKQYPPFGKATTIQWLCVVTNIPAFMIATSVLLVIVGALAGFIFSGGPIWMVFAFFDLLLFPINFIWLIIRLAYVHTILQRRRIITTRWFQRPLKKNSRFRAKSGGRHAWVRESLATRDAWEAPKTQYKHPMAHMGIGVHGDHAKVGTQYVWRAHPEREQGPRPWGESVLYGMHSTLMAMHKLFTPTAFKRVWKYGFLNTRDAFGKNPYKYQEGPDEHQIRQNARRIDYVRFDHLVPEEQFHGFPYSHYLFDNHGVCILEDAEKYVVTSEHAAPYAGHVPFDEHTARYFNVEVNY